MKKYIYLIICFILINFAAINFSFAIDININDINIIEPPTIESDYTGNWDDLVTNILNLLTEIAGAALVIMLLYGGVSYITSAGNESQAEKAKGTITAAIIGIFIVIASWGIISFILSRFQT